MVSISECISGSRSNGSTGRTRRKMKGVQQDAPTLQTFEALISRRPRGVCTCCALRGVRSNLVFDTLHLNIF